MPIKREQAPGALGRFLSPRWIGNLGALSITALLFFLGAQPFAAGLFREPWDKLAHFIVFATLTGLLWLGSAGSKPLWIIAIVSLIGALDEWHQARLPGRSMDIADLAVDISAAILTLIALRVMFRKT